MKILLFIVYCILCTINASAQQGLIGNYLRLNPNALPATCQPGDTRFDSSGHKLNYCYPANTWSAVGSGSGGGTWGSITGTLSAQTDLNTALGLLAPLASPVFSGALSSTQISTPSSPASGKDSLYFKADNNLYSLSSAGLEQQIGPGIQGTNWSNTLSFTFSAGWGTPVGSSVWSRRVGDTLEVRGWIQNGTFAASALYIQLPASYLIDTAKLDSQANTQNIGRLTIYQNTGTDSLGTGGTDLFYDGSTNNQIFVAVTNGNTSPLAKCNGSSCLNNNGYSGFEFKVPIAGWTTQSPAAPGQSGANMFVSSAVTTGDTGNATGSFVTSSVSPALTFTPSVTGTYKVYASVPLNASSSASSGGLARIFNTSGSATLLYESQGEETGYSPGFTGVSSSAYIQSIYTLTAGTSYQFDVQTKAGTATIFVGGYAAQPQWYMFAELQAGTIGNGVTQVGTIDGNGSAANGSSLTNNILYEQSASSTKPGLVNNTTQTFSGSKTIGFNLTDAISIGAGGNNVNQTINGGLVQTVKVITSNYTLDTSEKDFVIQVNCSTACTLTLTAAATGRTIRVVDISGGAFTNNITITPNGVETINGSTNLIINVNNAAVDLNGTLATGWNIL